MKLRLAKLEAARVWNEDGSYFGRVFELRIDAKPGVQHGAGQPEIASMLCGNTGLLERLGWKQRTAVEVPWEQVLRIDRRGVTIRRRGRDYPQIKA